MFLVMGITGKVGGATARHLLDARPSDPRAWSATDRGRQAGRISGVELVDGDWNDAAAIERALDGVDGAFVMLPAVWAPFAGFQGSQGRHRELCRGTDQSTAPPRVDRALVDGGEQNQRARNDHGPVVAGAGLRDLASPVAFVRAGGFFENFLYGLHVAQGGTLPVYYNPTSRKSTMVATNDIGAEVATLLTGPAWAGHRVIELGSMVSADEVAAQLGDVMQRDVKAFAVPRAGWPAALEQLGIPKGQTVPAEAMFEAVNAGWMDLGAAGTEHVAGTTPPRDVFAAARQAVTA